MENEMDSLQVEKSMMVCRLIEAELAVSDAIKNALSIMKNWAGECDCEEYNEIYEYIDFESRPGKRIVVARCTQCGGILHL